MSFLVQIRGPVWACEPVFGSLPSSFSLSVCFPVAQSAHDHCLQGDMIYPQNDALLPYYEISRRFPFFSRTLLLSELMTQDLWSFLPGITSRGCTPEGNLHSQRIRASFSLWVHKVSFLFIYKWTINLQSAYCILSFLLLTAYVFLAHKEDSGSSLVG